MFSNSVVQGSFGTALRLVWCGLTHRAGERSRKTQAIETTAYTWIRRYLGFSLDLRTWLANDRELPNPQRLRHTLVLVVVICHSPVADRRKVKAVTVVHGFLCTLAKLDVVPTEQSRTTYQFRFNAFTSRGRIIFPPPARSIASNAEL